jgi:circadian clock protein KaiC
MYRLHEWLLRNDFTAIITSKVDGILGQVSGLPNLTFLQFMVDCAVTLKHELVRGVSQRNLHVVKYRGSSFAANEAPFLIGEKGMEVAGTREMDWQGGPVSNKRVSSGVPRLDKMLDGGYFRGASVLITGFPGTAKSTLSGAFAQAACGRGERTLFISFDSDANEVVRNLASVNIRLDRYVKKGLLRLVSARAITGSSEIHLMQIKKFAKEHDARCVIIDPVSALAKAADQNTAYSVAERLIDWAKGEGITLVCTSLLNETGPQVEGTPLQISTIADTWIHLNYLINAGERNRGLSIVKSRGTGHSNQVREILLSKAGMDLADAYNAGGEVLMGTLRWEKEQALIAAREEAAAAAEQRQAALESQEAELQGRLFAIQRELAAKRLEKKRAVQLAAKRKVGVTSGQSQVLAMRGGDLI